MDDNEQNLRNKVSREKFTAGFFFAMSRRAWVFVAAFGLILCSNSGHAKLETGNPKGRTTTQQEVAKLLTSAAPVKITEEKSAAEARKRSEAEARQRQIDDLVAQQDMDATAQKSLFYTRIQTWIAGIGTFFLLFTLYLSIRANKWATAAANAAIGANDLTKREQRAWLAVETYSFDPLVALTMQASDGFQSKFSVTVKNRGKTVATEVFVDANIILCTEDIRPDESLATFCERWSTDRGSSGQIVFPDQELLSKNVVAIFQQGIAENAHPPGVGFIDPYVLLCVTYRIQGTEERKQTGFAYPMFYLRDDGVTMVVNTNLPDWTDRVRIMQPFCTHVT